MRASTDIKLIYIIEKHLLPMYIKEDIQELFKEMDDNLVNDFFKNYVKLKNPHSQLEYLLMINKYGLSNQNEIFRKIKNGYYFFEKDNSENNEKLEKLEKVIEIVKSGNELIEKFVLEIPLAKSAISSIEAALGIGKIVQTSNDINANEKLRNNEVSHPELRNLISAIRFADAEKIDLYLDYYKSLDMEYNGFVTATDNSQQFVTNLLQATFCYLNLDYKIKQCLDLMPLSKMVWLLNKPFQTNSIKFSFNEQDNKNKNTITPENFSNENLKNVYEQMFLAQYHIMNIIELKEDNKNIDFKDLTILYFEGKLPLSKTEKEMAKERLNRNFTFFEMFEKKFKVQLNLLSNSCNNLLDKDNIFKHKKLFIIPTNSLVISAFIQGESNLFNIREKCLDLNLQTKILSNIYTLHIISKKLLEKINDHKYSQDLNSNSLINLNIIKLEKLKNGEFKFLLSDEILNEKVRVGSREKTFGEFMSEIGVLKRIIKEDLLALINHENVEVIKNLVEKLDVSLDKIFTNFPNKKLNNMEENIINLNKLEFPLSDWSLLAVTHISDKNNLNNYNKKNQNHFTIESIIKDTASIVIRNFDFVPEKIIEILKNRILSGIVNEEFLGNIREDMIIKEKISNIKNWTLTGLQRKDLIENKLENKISHENLVINGKIIESVKQRIIDLTKEEEDFKNKKLNNLKAN